MKFFASFVTIASASLFVSTPQAEAQWGGFVPIPQPVFEVDYQVWGLNPRPLWVWDVVVTHSDGSQTFSRGYESENAASYRLFKMIEWGLIDLENDHARIERRDDRQFELMGTYDTREQAEAIADFIEAFGWRSDIRAVITIARP